MSEPLSLREQDGALTIETGGVEIARYVFAAEVDPYEAPKPFYHPLRALDGGPVSAHRPWDHRWHKGLQMTLSHVNDQNFWGGPTFSVEHGYRPEDNLGVQRHQRFTDVRSSGELVGFEEALTWTTMAGEDWLTETRRQAFHSVEVDQGVWALDFATTLVNVAQQDLHLGSPTTAGRPAAGYTGLFWRGPRAFTGAAVLSADGSTEADQIMGSSSEWLAMTGQHDDVDGGATVVLVAGTSSAPVPIKWFVRSQPFPVMAPSPAFDQTVVLAPGETLSLSHRFAVIDRRLDREEVFRLAAQIAGLLTAI